MFHYSDTGTPTREIAAAGLEAGTDMIGYRQEFWILCVSAAILRVSATLGSRGEVEF